jgi:hypothetical protein
MKSSRSAQTLRFATVRDQIQANPAKLSDSTRGISGSARTTAKEYEYLSSKSLVGDNNLQLTTRA